MEKGILKLTLSGKGKIIVSLDRLNGRPPMSLSYVPIGSMDLNDKPCLYEMQQGKITRIEVDGRIVYGASAAPAPTAAQRPGPAAGGNRAIQQVADSFLLQETLLPAAVRELPLHDIDNFSLKYHKAARNIEDANGKSKFYFFKNDYRPGRNGQEATGHKFSIRPNYGNLSFEGIVQRQQAQVNALFGGGQSAVLRFSPDWRLICGLSGGIYETNMTLHHVYGIPYIPASSIKGVVRSWIIAKVFGQGSLVPAEEKEYPMINAEYRALKTSRLFCDLFGAPERIEKISFSQGQPQRRGKDYQLEGKEKSATGKEQQGMISFFEGLPTEPPSLAPDVINVHYPEWYKPEGYSAPTDYQSPVPVIFLTVEAGSTFQLAIGTHNRQPLSDWPDYPLLAEPVGLDGQASLLTLASKWLALALSEHGIGAKTAAGYGYMHSEPS